MLFKSLAKCLTAGSEWIPVGQEDLILRRGLAALVGEMLAESAIVEGATMFTWMVRFEYPHSFRLAVGESTR